VISSLLETYADPNASVAHLLCDRHPQDAVAFRLLDQELVERTVSYGELRELSERFAAGLASLGVGVGDRVATLMGKGVDQLVATVGLWRLGAVHVPLFTAFAPPAIQHRLTGAEVKVVVTDDAQRPKLTDGSYSVIVAGSGASGDVVMADLLAQHPAGLPAVAVGGDGALLQLYTSGTTGTPKAVVMPVRGLAAVHAYLTLGLDVRPDDVYWNAADPGWAYGHYYGLMGPLLLGVPGIWVTGGFDPALCWRVLSELGVTNFAAAPTIYRALRQHEGKVSLRCASAAGEPLTPEVNEWATGALGTEVHDHYGQTETGMLVNTHHHESVFLSPRPGVMGTTMPGWRTAVLREDALEEAPAGETGRLAVDVAASPLMWFSGYPDAPDKTAEKLVDGWYLTGDAAWIGPDGLHHFVARDDDVIIMAGYRIGPFDVESVLLQHPSVVEAAAVAAPDPLKGEVIEAYVVLADGAVASDELVRDLQQRVKTGYAAHAYPRAVHFVDALPKTPSGKVQRYVLRQQRAAQ
jgi:acetyl-CoA synthetase